MDILERSIEDLESLYKSLQVKSGEPCAYCGLLATDKEHVTPRSYIENMRYLFQMGLNVKIPREVLVPSCRECNLIASNKLFKNFTEKKKYIKEQLRKKYKKFARLKLWTDEEILELDGRLKEEVYFFNKVATIIKKRLRF